MVDDVTARKMITDIN